jgi:hypothetical protein
MNTLKELLLAFVVVFVASLASSLAAAAIYNIWFAPDAEAVVVCPQVESPNGPPLQQRSH